MMNERTLTVENYRDGFLMDHEWIGGVSERASDAGSMEYIAYIFHHGKGELLGAHTYLNLDEALGAINKIERTWEYALAPKGCSSGGCGCGSGGCGSSEPESSVDGGAEKMGSCGGGCCCT